MGYLRSFLFAAPLLLALPVHAQQAEDAAPVFTLPPASAPQPANPNRQGPELDVFRAPATTAAPPPVIAPTITPTPAPAQPAPQVPAQRTAPPPARPSRATPEQTAPRAAAERATPEAESSPAPTPAPEQTQDPAPASRPRRSLPRRPTPVRQKKHRRHPRTRTPRPGRGSSAVRSCCWRSPLSSCCAAVARLHRMRQRWRSRRPRLFRLPPRPKPRLRQSPRRRPNLHPSPRHPTHPTAHGWT